MVTVYSVDAIFSDEIGNKFASKRYNMQYPVNVHVDLYLKKPEVLRSIIFENLLRRSIGVKTFTTTEKIAD